MPLNQGRKCREFTSCFDYRGERRCRRPKWYSARMAKQRHHAGDDVVLSEWREKNDASIHAACALLRATLSKLSTFDPDIVLTSTLRRMIGRYLTVLSDSD